MTATLEAASPSEVTKLEKLAANEAKIAQERAELASLIAERTGAWQSHCEAVAGTGSQAKAARNFQSSTLAWVEQHKQYLLGTIDGRDRHSECGRLARELGATVSALPSIAEAVAGIEKQLAVAVENAKRFATSNSIDRALWPQELLG